MISYNEAVSNERKLFRNLLEEYINLYFNDEYPPFIKDMFYKNFLSYKAKLQIYETLGMLFSKSGQTQFANALYTRIGNIRGKIRGTDKTRSELTTEPFDLDEYYEDGNEIFNEEEKNLYCNIKENCDNLSKQYKQSTANTQSFCNHCNNC